MWLFKGIVLDGVLFAISFFAYAFAVAYRMHLAWDSAVCGPGDMLTTLIVRNPYFWPAFAGALGSVARWFLHSHLLARGPSCTQ